MKHARITKTYRISDQEFARDRVSNLAVGSAPSASCSAAFPSHGDEAKAHLTSAKQSLLGHPIGLPGTVQLADHDMLKSLGISIRPPRLALLSLRLWPLLGSAMAAKAWLLKLGGDLLRHEGL